VGFGPCGEPLCFPLQFERGVAFRADFREENSAWQSQFEYTLRLVTPGAQRTITHGSTFFWEQFDSTDAPRYC
jgi:hypothetical protein